MGFEFDFEINQVFDKNKEYDLFICTCSFALSDLLLVNNGIGKFFDDSSRENSSFLFRINMGFAREAFELLKNKFEDENFRLKYLENVEDAFDRYKEIKNIINGNSDLKTFKEHKINENRHIIFHYPKKPKDIELIEKVLDAIEEDGQKFKYYETDVNNKLERQNLDFVKIIQYNTTYGIYKVVSEEEHIEKLRDMAALTSKIINLLNLLFVDFMSKKYMDTKNNKNR